MADLTLAEARAQLAVLEADRVTQMDWCAS